MEAYISEGYAFKGIKKPLKLDLSYFSNDIIWNNSSEFFGDLVIPVYYPLFTGEESYPYSERVAVLISLTVCRIQNVKKRCQVIMS